MSIHAFEKKFKYSNPKTCICGIKKCNHSHSTNISTSISYSDKPYSDKPYSVIKLANSMDMAQLRNANKLCKQDWLANDVKDPFSICNIIGVQNGQPFSIAELNTSHAMLNHQKRRKKPEDVKSNPTKEYVVCKSSGLKKMETGLADTKSVDTKSVNTKKIKNNKIKKTQDRFTSNHKTFNTHKKSNTIIFFKSQHYPSTEIKSANTTSIDKDEVINMQMKDMEIRQANYVGECRPSKMMENAMKPTTVNVDKLSARQRKTIKAKQKRNPSKSIVKADDDKKSKTRMWIATTVQSKPDNK